MTDDDGRVLHLCIREAKASKTGRDLILVPSIGIHDVYVDEYRKKYSLVKLIHADIHQYRFCVAFLWFRWSFAFAEFRDDRSVEEIKKEYCIDD